MRGRLSGVRWHRGRSALATVLALLAYFAAAGLVSAANATFTATTATTASFGSATQFYSAVVAADSPLGYWRFDESSGTNAVDRSGNSWTCSYLNSPTLRRPGALTADPSTAVGLDGTADGASAIDRNDFLGTASFSLEAWVKPVSIGAAFSGEYHTIVRKYGSSSGYWLWLNADYGVGIERLNSGGTDQYYTGAMTLTGAWHYIVATYNGTTLRIYVDGTQRGAGGASSRAIVDSAAGVDIGYYAGWSGGMFNGDIDDVAIFGSTLSAARITAHYNKGITG